MKRCAEIIDDCGLNPCGTGDCINNVNGYTCDCDEDHELMLQVNGPACVARNVKNSSSNEFRLKVYGATQCWPNRSRFTTRAFDRGGVFVAACSIWSHAHTRIQLGAMQHQSSSQRVGALLIHRPAWVDQHTGGSRLTPTVHRCPKGMAMGGPCDQTAQQYSAETPQT